MHVGVWVGVCVCVLVVGGCVGACACVCESEGEECYALESEAFIPVSVQVKQQCVQHTLIGIGLLKPQSKKEGFR